MHIDETIAALCGNPSAQRRAQSRIEQAREQWLASKPAADVLAELAEYGAGADFEDCSYLARAIETLEGKSSLIEPLIEGISRALGDEPLAHVPFRHQKNGGTSILQLATRGRAALVLLAYDETTADPSPATVTFSDVERHELVLAGAADLRMATLVQEWPDRAAIDLEDRRVVAGESLRLAPNEARLSRAVHGRMVVLRFARTPSLPAPSRVFSLADGCLMHRASGDRQESQREMAMALLGRMRRRDAAPALAAQARTGSDHLRWQALRECLALDTGTGFAELLRIAQAPEDPLAAPAQALHAQLIEAYPQLKQQEAARCPA